MDYSYGFKCFILNYRIITVNPKKVMIHGLLFWMRFAWTYHGSFWRYRHVQVWPVISYDCLVQYSKKRYFRPVYSSEPSTDPCRFRPGSPRPCCWHPNVGRSAHHRHGRWPQQNLCDRCGLHLNIYCYLFIYTYIPPSLYDMRIWWIFWNT